MPIGWYPGHMNKARKDIIHALEKVDAILEVVDARLPCSSENPMLKKLAGGKPSLKLLNKSDLADPEITRQWLAYYRGGRIPAAAIQKDRPAEIREKIIRHFAAARKEVKPPFRVMVVGIPNAGKSTLINILCGRKIARTGNEPAITRGQQEIMLDDDFALVDTPGILWPKIDNQDSAYRLAVTGAIRNTAIEFEDIALFAVEFLKQRYPDRLLARYGLETSAPAPEMLLKSLGRKRGCLRKGGVDMNKAGEILLNDIRGGKLGPLSLETPADIRRTAPVASPSEQLE